ncbi:MAG: alpha/beta hydrolase [Azospirillaceae bacterium]
MATAIFGDYDQDGLDAQYNLRPLVPDFQTHFDAWARDSEAAREAHPPRILSYGPHPRARLDLFVPTTAPGSGAPLLVFIHGGYWRTFDRTSFSFVAPPFLARDCAVAVLEYPLAPDARMAEIVAHVRDAVAWLARNAEMLGLDAGRLVVAGHSAGGHLAGMVAATQWVELDLPRTLIKGMIGISGLYDLEAIRLCFLDEDLKLTAEDDAAYSPARLPPRLDGPAVAAVGGLETAEYHRQTRNLVAAWSGAAEIRPMIVEGRHHFDILGRLATPGDPLHEAALTALR